MIAAGTVSARQNLNLAATERLITRNPDSAFVQIQHLIRHYQSTGEQRLLGISYQQLGAVLHYQGAYQQALVNYYKANKIFIAGHDKRLIAKNLTFIGDTYSSALLKNEALIKFNEALNLYRESRDKNGVAETLCLLGKQYAKTSEYRQGLNCLAQALAIYQGMSDSINIAKVYAAVGATYDHHLKLNSALQYLQKALSMNRSLHAVFPQMGILNNIGDVHRKSGRIDDALTYTRQAKDLAALLKNNKQLLSAFNDLRDCFKAKRNTDSTYYYTEAASLLYRKIYQEESSRQLNILQTLFEVEHKNNEIVKLKIEKRLTLITSSGLLLISFLILLLGYVIVSRQRLRNRNEKIILEAQKNNAELELKNKFLEQAKLNEQLELKSKELTSHTLHIIQKNQLLEDLKDRLNAIVKADKRDQRKEIKQLVALIDNDSNIEKNWSDFRSVFESVHTGFFAKVNTYSDNLTSSDLRLMALLKMNLTSADIATMIGISQESLRTAKYRLRQKLKLPEGENLMNFILQL